MSARSYATTARDIGRAIATIRSGGRLPTRTALRLSLIAVPPSSPLLEAIDDAIKACREDRSHAYDAARFNDICEALDHLHTARRLAAGEQS